MTKLSPRVAPVGCNAITNLTSTTETIRRQVRGLPQYARQSRSLEFKRCFCASPSDTNVALTSCSHSHL